MTGHNRYLDVQHHYSHLHETFEKRAAVDVRVPPTTEPCIFLSHRSTDKEAVKKIGAYIMRKGIDVYLDIDDPDLQRAVESNDHKAITAAIELGVANSSNLLAYLTKNTATSPWVPYEIGYAKRSGKDLAAIKSKDLAILPSYLEIVRRITGRASLESYLEKIRPSQRLFPNGSSEKVTTILERIKRASVAGELSAYLDAE